MRNLGEVWIPGQDSDEGYTGETGGGIQYVRNKAREFQMTLNAVDETSRILENALAELMIDSATGANVDPTLIDDLTAYLEEYESKKTVFRTTAEAINLAASGINALGGRFPELSIPSGLAAPIVIPFALVAAVGVAAGLILWGNTWIQGVSERMKISVQAGLISDPVKRDAFVMRIAEIDAQAAAASGSGLSNVAGVVKWGAIAFGAFLAFKAFTEFQTSRGD